MILKRKHAYYHDPKVYWTFSTLTAILSGSSFRPWYGAMDINDWTNIKKELKIYFASLLFMKFSQWQWNLAITYPQHDRAIPAVLTKDVQCAFPQIVVIHSLILINTLTMVNTGLPIDVPVYLATNCTNTSTAGVMNQKWR